MVDDDVDVDVDVDVDPFSSVCQPINSPLWHVVRHPLTPRFRKSWFLGEMSRIKLEVIRIAIGMFALSLPWS